MVKDVLLSPDRVPVLPPTTLLKQALEEMNKFRLGVVCVTDEDEKLIGIFTDGDVRRLLLKSQKPFAALFVDDIIVHATSSFTSINDTASLSEAVVLMEKKEIWDLPVIAEGDGKFLGLLHLHPAIKAVMGL
ncbi:MAG: CBS domain-containing protein [Rhodospirillaceae bacterium]|nr:CBS domain-containing protein [Rhodospirillaceae bacterium]